MSDTITVRRIIRSLSEPGGDCVDIEFSIHVVSGSSDPHRYSIGGVRVHRDEYMAALATITAGRANA